MTVWIYLLKVALGFLCFAILICTATLIQVIVEWWLDNRRR